MTIVWTSLYRPTSKAHSLCVISVSDYYKVLASTVPQQWHTTVFLHGTMSVFSPAHLREMGPICLQYWFCFDVEMGYGQKTLMYYETLPKLHPPNMPWPLTWGGHCMCTSVTNKRLYVLHVWLASLVAAPTDCTPSSPVPGGVRGPVSRCTHKYHGHVVTKCDRIWERDHFAQNAKIWPFSSYHHSKIPRAFGFILGL